MKVLSEIKMMNLPYGWPKKGERYFSSHLRDVTISSTTSRPHCFGNISSKVLPRYGLEEV